MMIMVLQHVVVFCITILVIAPFAASLDCYNCNDKSHPIECNNIVTCRPNEVCYVEKRVTRDNVTYFNSGCKASNNCSVIAHKRNTGNLECSECCNHDFCNKQQCDNTPISSYYINGVRCLSCDDVNDPADCRTTTMCDMDSACSTHQIFNSVSFRRIYKLGCSFKRLCTVFNTMNHIVGRSVDGMYCHQCCYTENCNQKLCRQGSLNATSSPTAHTQ